MMPPVVRELPIRRFPEELARSLSRTHPGVFLLEPVPGANGETFAIVGFDPVETCDDRRGDDPFQAVRDLLDAKTTATALPFTGGVVGAIAYDAIHRLDSPRHPANPPHHLLGRYMDAILFERSNGRCLYATHDDDRSREVLAAAAETPDAPAFSTSPPRSSHDRTGFAKMVDAVKERILEGEVYQAVVSREFEGTYDGRPIDRLASLRPSGDAYRYFFDLRACQVVGASPEPLLRVRGQDAETFPIAGTRPRGRDASDDASLASSLVEDVKEQAEHLMLVDLARNDLGRVARVGTVRVDPYAARRSFETVHHLVSRVTARLRDDVDGISALASLFPAGTVSGAPKIRAMELIDRLEHAPRGLYGGAAGLFGFDGSIETLLTIRTLLARPDGTYRVRAGAGIVQDSVPSREFDETAQKAASMLPLLEAAA